MFEIEYIINKIIFSFFVTVKTVLYSPPLVFYVTGRRDAVPYGLRLITNYALRIANSQQPFFLDNRCLIFPAMLNSTNIIAFTATTLAPVGKSKR